MKGIKSVKPKILNSVKAQQGSTLRCKGWKQEAILRMMENNMANGERPAELIIYGGRAKCARNWESYYAIRNALMQLEIDETLVVQSGMPAAVFRTHRLAPSVIMANSNMIQANWPEFNELLEKNLISFASYTAGPWQYIGSQGVIQGTFETLGCVADRHYGGSLAGKIFLTAGLGGMGQSQPTAMNMHGGVSLAIEIDGNKIRKRIEGGMVDQFALSLEEGVRLITNARDEKRSLGVAVQGNAAECFEALLEKGWRPDVITEMCPCHDPLAYIPVGYDPETAAKLRHSDPTTYTRLARESMIRHLRAMNGFKEQGVPVFEYGTFIRSECIEGGMDSAEATIVPGYMVAYVRDMYCEGRGPFRWTCISGSVEDQKRLDDLALELFPKDHMVQRWIPLARDLPVEGLPARICFLGFGQRKKFGLAVNELVRRGDLAGPVAFARDNLDSGSIVNPLSETEDMKDGSDKVADWPYLNAMLNVAGMADLVTVQANGAMGISAHTGVTMIADGTEEAALRLEACLTTDAGIGVVRHAQAGYEIAREVALGKGRLTDESISIPLWWTAEATFGPDEQ
jgi:urocanate hydratase